ncbi:hypothetical protein HNQ56_001070 [Anaerotaenia torta]|uniref:discoidin domain-containing protein n=1 Tax=Anaerotaenia torta TaxID=433293 RepID=UPI003D247224
MKIDRKIIGIILLGMIAAALVSCGKKGGSAGENDPPEIPAETKEVLDTEYIGASVAVQEVGKMLPLSAMEEAYQAVSDNSGMSGNGGRIHLHSNAAEDMYKGDGKDFIFDIGHIDQLGELYIWNYNGEGDTASGLKEIAVSYSEDNIAYSEPVSYILEEATGEDGGKAAGTDKGRAVGFNGASARYIKLTALRNYGGSGNGLSEVRLFRYKQPAAAGESIACSPLERYINGKWSAAAEDYNFVNGTGLSDRFSAEAVHDNKPEHMFSQKASAIDFLIDLKGQYPVSQLVLWNYNDPEHLDYGLQDFRLKISDDCTTWKTVGSYTLDRADGSEELPPSIIIDMKNVQTHYIRIEIMSNYGGSRVGLSEAAAFLGEGWYCEEAPDYTALFSRYEGWAGADGIYTVNLDGKDYNYQRDKEEQNTFFVFSDTIISKVDPRTDLRSEVLMLNNTSALLRGGLPDPGRISFRIQPKDGNTANILPSPGLPATKAGKEIYYWLGDTFVIGDYLYVYALRIDSVPTVFGFEQIGADLARYDIVDGAVNYSSLKLINDDKKQLCDTADSRNKWYFGGAVYQSTEEAGVMNPDGYIYVYGYNDVENKGRRLVVSRVKPENIENFGAYEYLSSDGGWSREVPSEFLSLEEGVAPECSVTQLQSGENKGKYLFVWSHLTNTATIKASISDTPYTPFRDQTIIYTHDTTLTIPGKGNNTYNAKAHPALSGPEEILISYNVNGEDCFRYGDIYRPRFLRLAMTAAKNKAVPMETEGGSSDNESKGY